MKCVGSEKLVNPNSENIFSDDLWLSLYFFILTLYNDQKKIFRKWTAYNIKIIVAGT